MDCLFVTNFFIVRFFLFHGFEYFLGRDDSFNEILIFDFGTECLMVGTIWVDSKDDRQLFLHHRPELVEVLLLEIELHLIVFLKQLVLVWDGLRFPLSLMLLIPFRTFVISSEFARSFPHCWTFYIRFNYRYYQYLLTQL